MFCWKCGEQMPDNAVFCPKCGSGINEAPKDSAVTVPSAGSTPSAKRPNKKLIAGIVAAVVVVALVVGGGIWWKTDQDAKAAQEAYNRAHVSQVVPVPVEAPEFDDAASSIPVQVTGVDLDGNAVDEVQYLTPVSMQVTLIQGTYDLLFPGGYFTGAGHLAAAPGTKQHVEVRIPDNANDSNANGATKEAESSSSGDESTDSPSTSAALTINLETIDYTIVADVDVTDEQIAEVEKWAQYDNANSTKVGQLKVTVVANRDAAVAEKQRQEEEARKAAEEEAARKAAEEEAARKTTESQSSSSIPNYPANSNSESDTYYNFGKGYTFENVHLEADSNGDTIIVGTFHNNSNSPVKSLLILYGCTVNGDDYECDYENNGGEKQQVNIAPGSTMRVELRKYKNYDKQNYPITNPNDVVHFNWHGNWING